MPIIIPEKHYVGLKRQSRDESDLLLGFATPYGDDKAFEKRKSTVDHWASGRYWYNSDEDKGIPAKILDNTLSEGFRIADIVRRHGWNGGNVVWRIVDPRGFELEISSANMASIMDCSTLINGTIQGKCIWGREGNSNVLLPENSQPYQQAIEQTKIKNATPMSVKDLNVGDVIVLQNNKKAIYFGAFSAVRASHAPDTHDSFGRDDLKLDVQKRHLLYVFNDFNTPHNDVDIFSDIRYGADARAGEWNFTDRVKVAMVVEPKLYQTDQKELASKLLSNAGFRYDVTYRASVVTLTPDAIDKKSLRIVLVPLKDQSIFDRIAHKDTDFYELYGSFPYVAYVTSDSKGIAMHPTVVAPTNEQARLVYRDTYDLADIRMASFNSSIATKEIVLSTISSASFYYVLEELHRRGERYNQYSSFASRVRTEHPKDTLRKMIGSGGAWYTVNIAYNDTMVPYTG